MLATDFFFLHCLLLRHACLHTKSQQKSTHGKYVKNPSVDDRHVFMLISHCKLFHQDILLF